MILQSLSFLLIDILRKTGSKKSDSVRVNNDYLIRFHDRDRVIGETLIKRSVYGKAKEK